MFAAVFQVGSMVASPLMNVGFDLIGSYKPMFIILAILMAIMLGMIYFAISSAKRLREGIPSVTDTVKAEDKSVTEDNN